MRGTFALGQVTAQHILQSSQMDSAPPPPPHPPARGRQDTRLDILSFEEGEQELRTRWRFSATLDLPWRPILAAAGGTTHVFDPVCGGGRGRAGSCGRAPWGGCSAVGCACAAPACAAPWRLGARQAQAQPALPSALLPAEGCAPPLGARAPRTRASW